MSLCGQSPLFVPTTVNAQIRNIDAVDIGADTIHCTNLSVNGEAISGMLQNIESSTTNLTKFKGEVYADFLNTNGEVHGDTVTANTMTCEGPIEGESLTVTGSVSGLLGAFDSMSAVTTDGNITQTAGTASLQATTVAGNITQSTGTASLQATTVAGNLTMSGTSAVLSQTGSSATASLKATTVTSLTSSGNITQSAGTTTLKKTTINGDSTAYLLGAYNSSMTSGTSVWTEVGADSSNGLVTEFTKGSGITTNTASLSLSSSASSGVLNIAYDNINAPTFKTDNLTVNTAVILPTTFTTPTTGQLGYGIGKSGNNAVTLSTTLQEVAAMSTALGVGVWFVTFHLKVSLAANTAANQLLTVLYGDGAQLAYYYTQITATTTAIDVTVVGSRVVAVSTAYTTPMSLQCSLKTAATTITTVSNTDARISSFVAYRIA